MKIDRSLALLPAAAIAVGLLTACEPAEPSGQGAAVMCEQFLTRDDTYLKSPGSAKFSGVSETKIKTLSDKKPWKFQVQGWVDSQNGFGALKRNTYKCVLSTKDGETWTREELRLLTTN